MNKLQLMDRYPVLTLDIPKAETTCTDIDAVVARLRQAIEADKRAIFIADFDHYAHTRSLGGPIAEGICGARNLVFCFGPHIPNPQILGVRPRSLGIAECADRFVVSFMEPPMPFANEAMSQWCEELRDRI